MIADIAKNANSSEIKKYVNYCISPKKEQENEPKEARAQRLKFHKELKKSDKLSNERVAAFYSDEMEARPGAVDGFVELIETWTRESKKGRPATSKTPKVLMGSFSWSPKDRITPDRAVELAREYLLEEMGGSYRPGMFVCHVDKEHTHVHFVVAAVGADGLVYDPAGRGETFRAMERVMEKMEVAEQYTRVKQRKAMAEIDPTRQVRIAAANGADIQNERRTGEAQPDQILRVMVWQASKEADGNFDEFLDLLGKKGVRAVPNIKQGHMAGFSFGLASEPFEHRKAAGDLGTKYKWSNMAEGLHYDETVHLNRLQALKTQKGVYMPPPEITKIVEVIQPVAVEVTPPAPVDIADLTLALNAPTAEEEDKGWTQEQIDAAIVAGIETRDKKQAIVDAESIVAQSLGLTLAEYRKTQSNPQQQHTDYSVGLNEKEQEQKNEDEHDIK